MEAAAPHDEALALALAGDAKSIRDGVVALVLRLAAAETFGTGDDRDDQGPAGGSASIPRGPRVADSAARGALWMTRAGLCSPCLVGPCTGSIADARHMATWVDTEAFDELLRALSGTPPGPSRVADLGALYEELLTLGVRRLEDDTVLIQASGVWVSTRALLGEPRDARSKWLQRMAHLPKGVVQRLGAALAAAETPADAVAALAPLCARRTKAREGGELAVEASGDRRRSGSHYTPALLSRAVITRALGPLLDGAPSSVVLSLRVCDPAMGSGAFLVEAANFLADRLAEAWKREARGAEADDRLTPRRAALRAVVSECLYGVDLDPIAVDLARWSLARLAWTGDEAPRDLSPHLRCGDALVGRATPRDAPGPLPHEGFDWPTAFGDVLSGRGGFDACLGNPPWVAYAGRAAQPLDPRLAGYYERVNPAFHGYRTLHGLFIRRAAELARGGGRLGLVVPTSVADLDGYAPTRSAHDALCEVDRELLDFEDGAFQGVFQPCMALTSTRTHGERTGRAGAPWSLARTDLAPVAARLLERIASLPHLCPHLFGERGFQTTGNDLARLRRQGQPEPPFTVPIRVGGDVAEFAAGVPRTYLDPHGLSGHFRSSAEWARVRIIIRQTARYPMAALSDGCAFRNSILAGFSNEEWSPHALVAYLNSSAVRWYHFMSRRDARQGMPQLKIGHLRALPDVRDAEARASLEALGRALGERNTGVLDHERSALDEVAFAALGHDATERRLVLDWARDTPPPKPRGR
jgi:hypothetical protein